MATKIVNRQPFSIDYDLDDINQGIFVMSEFKGICDNENDVTIDQSTFSDANNIYVDTNNVLQSRSPIKFNDNTGHIVNQWYFGEYGIRLVEIFETAENIEHHTYYLYCFTHECYFNATDKKYNYIILTRPIDTDNKRDDKVIKVTPVWIEDKVFFWIAGMGIYAFNLAGELITADDYNTRLPYFEDGVKYLYIPITKLMTNGLESELESENFLTSAYRRRYLYSAESPLPSNIEEGKSVTVQRTNTDGALEKLYTIKADENLKYKLVYPQSVIGRYGLFNLNGEYYFDSKIVNGILVILRFNLSTNIIEVSYGGNIFYKLPYIYIDTSWDEYPRLSDDGMCACAITRTGLAFCNLFAATSDESQITLLNNFVWEIEIYDVSLEGIWTADIHFKVHSRNEWIMIYEDILGLKWFKVKLQKPDGTTVSYSYSSRENDGFGQMILNIHLSLDFYSNVGKEIIDGKFGNIQFDTSSYLFFLTVIAEDHRTYFIQFAYWMEQIRLAFWNVDREIGNDVMAPQFGDIRIYPYAFLQPIHANPINSMYTIMIATPGLFNGDILHFAAINYDVDVDGTSTVTTIFTKRILQSTEHSKTSVRLIFDDSGKYLLTSNNVLTNLPLSSEEEWNIDSNIIELPLSDVLVPMAIDVDNIYFIKDDMLWTNVIDANNILSLDVYENVTYEQGSLEDFSIQINSNVPDNYTQLGDYYLSFVDFTDGQNKLLVTDTRRDEETDDFLLYLPVSSEQRFTQRINNIHPLADNMMGIFCDDAIWYIQALNLDNETVTRYTKAIRSKLPVGNRKNDEILTADNGQAILFPTPRGIAYLSPEDFVATTDRSIKYITDAIQNFYNDFYFDDVENAYAKNKGYDIKSMIKMTTYSYWILFYKYLDSTILLLDTRSNTWWKWSVQYPIMQINGKDNLTLLLLMDKADESYHGVSFLYCDKSYNTYEDDIITNVYIGNYLVETTAYGERVIYQYANSDIDWNFTSQKLHFGAINNYKRISSVNINANGEGAIVTNYETKAFRDYYHPEDSTTVAVKINDLRTFVQRCNIMHVVNFQFGLSNYTEVDDIEPLSLNSISIKYEVKGVVR